MLRSTSLLLFALVICAVLPACELLGGDRLDEGVNVVQHPEDERWIGLYETRQVDEVPVTVSGDTITLRKVDYYNSGSSVDSIKRRLELLTREDRLPKFISYWHSKKGGLYEGEIRIARWNPPELVLGELEGHFGNVNRTAEHMPFWSDFNDTLEAPTRAD